MSFYYSFRFAEDMKDILQLEKHLLAQPLSYPCYEDWVNRTIKELQTEYKKAILAFSDNFLVGDLIFQPHKDFPELLLEFKNMRIHPKLQRRYFGAFMFRNGEVEAREENYKAIICDFHSDNIPMINLLKFMGYEELLRIPLYDRNVEEIVMVRRFEGTPSGLFAPIKQKIISGAA